MRHSPKRKQSGSTVLEFTLSLLVLTPLLLGTFVFGFRMVRSQQTDQITRDLAHIYSRPNTMNFATAAGVSEAQLLANQYGLTSSGSSVVIFSTITIETATGCQSGAGAPTCANLNLPVFTQQIAIGNATANQSPFGTPTSGGSLPATNGVSNDYSANPSASDLAKSSFTVAQNFNSVLALNAGETCYMVEMFNNTPDLQVPGLTGAPQVYSRAIF